MTARSEGGPSEAAIKRFEQVAWAFLGYLVLVILFGAWVRISHSGAGCGSHWPTCHGELIPTAPSTKTIIEFTHRLTSGLCGIFGFVIIGWAYKRFGARSLAFKSALVTMFFIILEGAIGAGLVLKELVASDDSVARAVIISLHLVNTMALTGSAALIALAAKPTEVALRWSKASALKWLCVIGAMALMMTNMAGAVTALGDTLFPKTPTLGPGLFAEVRADLSAANHFLVRLRSIHPILAVLSASYLLAMSQVAWNKLAPGTPGRRVVLVLVAGVFVQVSLGVINIALAAPGAMQLFHLLGANVVWLALFTLGFYVVAKPAEARG